MQDPHPLFLEPQWKKFLVASITTKLDDINVADLSNPKADQTHTTSMVKSSSVFLGFCQGLNSLNDHAGVRRRREFGPDLADTGRGRGIRQQPVHSVRHGVARHLVGR